jgi:hypothetical protein
MSDTASLSAALGDRYVIERELGAGGMATVYLARDVKYDRHIALKVLRPELAAVLGAERFLNEIRVTARLDHPHILTLIDSGESGGFLWYVLPYIRGESLRDRLTRERQLGIDESLTIARQVAGALDYAHSQRVVHRDIKPENILLHEGEAMLADFGIALAVREAGGNRLTETGLSLGTPQYMSPEQATGDHTLDARSDVYSLGAVVYEMLAGEPPVTGPTVQAVIAKLLTERPMSMRTVRDTVPKGVDDAVAKALAKVPADRFPSAGEFARALGEGQRAMSAGPEKPRRRRWLPAAVGLGVLAVLGGSWLAVRALRPRVPELVVRDRVQVTFTGEATSPAISDDGTQLAFVVRRCEAATCEYGVEVQDIGGSASRRVFDGATALYLLEWSPDRRFLLLNGTIGERYGSYLISILGGAPRYVGPGRATFFPSSDSLLLASPPTDSVPRLWTTTLDGGRGDSVTIGRAGERVWFAAVMPDARWIVADFTTEVRREVRVLDRQGRVRDVYPYGLSPATASTNQSRVSADALWLPVYRQPGSSQAALARLAVDRSRGRFRVPADTVLFTSNNSPVGVAADGRTVAYVEGSSQYALWALDLSDALRGRFPPERLLRSTTSPSGAVVAPDGRRVVLSRQVSGAGGGRTGLGIVPIAGGAEVSIAPSGPTLGFGWMPDGTAVHYAEKSDGRVRFVTADARSGARRSVFTTADSNVQNWDPLGNTGWAWIPPSGRAVRIQRLGESAPSDLPLPDGVELVFQVNCAPDGSQLALSGWNSTFDSILVYVITLSDQRAARWATFFAEGGGASWLGDGSLVVVVNATAETSTLYRVGGPGRARRLGTIPRPADYITVSVDARRVSLRTRDFRGDVWLAHLAPAR